MLRRRFFFVLALPVLAQEESPIRVEVNLVNVPFSVRDTRGQLIKTLTKDEVEVLEDGAPQIVSHFSQGADSKLSLGLLADVSGSQREFLKEHRRHLHDFLKNVMQPSDQAFLVGFGNNLRLISPFTGKFQQITDNLKRFQKGDDIDDFSMVGPREIRTGGTAFYDAIYHGAEDLLSQADTGRRALIVFSDGEDNSSAHHMMDAIEAAQRAGATVFCLRYTELKRGRWNARNKYGRSVMERISKDTGGMDFDAAESDDLRDAFRQIADILRASYDLGYRSSNGERDGSFRKVQLRAKRPGLVFRHKTGYFAK